MDAVEISSRTGDKNDPARVRITHEGRVLDTTTRFALTITPLDADKFQYAPYILDESPPVPCYLYDWLQYINFKVQRELQHAITGKENQLQTLDAFDAYPRKDATFCEIDNPIWEPVYTSEPAQTAELYILLDRLLKSPEVEFEEEGIVSIDATRVTPLGDIRVTPAGDTRITVLKIASEAF